MHTDVAVIGAGPAGLAAAHRARERYEVEVFERRPRAGGRVRSSRRDGYLVEAGASLIRGGVAPLDRMIEELGLAGDRVRPGPEVCTRYLVRGGRLVARPRSPAELITTPLLSTVAKLRLLAEPFVRPPVTSREETVASFVRRRLGREVLEYGAEPFAAGMFAGMPDRLELAHALPRLYETVRTHGSLGRAWIHHLGRRIRRHLPFTGSGGAARNGQARNGSSRGRPGGEGSANAGSPDVFTFEDGIGTLADALVEQLERPVRLGRGVRELERVDGRFRFLTDGAEGARRWTAERVILAVPAFAISRVFAGPAPGTGPLDEVPYPPLSVVALGYRRERVAHPLDGFGVLVPEREPYRVVGVLFSSSIDPHRAPEGHVLLTCFVGGMRAPERARMSEEELVDLAAGDVENLLGAAGPPAFRSVHRWEHAIPQYQPGHERVVRAAEELETTAPGLYLAGSYRGGVSLANAVASGRAAADRLFGREGTSP